PVQLQRRPRHTLLAVDGQVPVAGRLRQPGRLGRAGSERRSGGRPGERYAAAVPTGLRPARAKEGRILTDLVGERGCVGEAELLALIEVCGAREPEHQGRCRPCPSQAEVAVRLRVLGANSVDTPAVSRQPETGRVTDD